MPIYDVTCKKCGKKLLDQRFTFDDVKKINSEEPIELTCECGNHTFDKEIAVSGKHPSWKNW